MPQQTTATYGPSWHAAHEQMERTILDQWARGEVCPTCHNPIGLCDAHQTMSPYLQLAAAGAC